MTNTQQCSNRLCGYPVVSERKCPYCSTPLGSKLYPFELRLLATVAAISVLIVFILLGLNSMRICDISHQTAIAQSSVIAVTETAPLPTWETHLKSGDITFNRTDPFGNSPFVMIWNETDRSIRSLIPDQLGSDQGCGSSTEPTVLSRSPLPRPLGLNLDQGVWLIANDGVRRFTAQITENNSSRLSVGEDQTDGAFVWRLSPDGKWLGHNARTDFGREIRLYSLADRTTLTTDFRRNTVDFVWSSDAQWIILNLTEGATNTLRVVPSNDLQSNPDRTLSDNAHSIASGLIGAVDWSSQGIVAYSFFENNRLSIRFNRYDPLNRGNEALGMIDLSSVIPEGTLVRSLRWSPNGDHLAFTVAQTATDDRPRFYLMESTKRWGLVLHELMPARPYASPAWISDHEVLIVGSDHQPWVINITEHQHYLVTNLGVRSETIDYIKPK